jgi:hypothetical protein
MLIGGRPARSAYSKFTRGSSYARQAGIDHIGEHAVDAGTEQSARIADTDDANTQGDGDFTADDDSDFADGGDDFGGGDSDFA